MGEKIDLLLERFIRMGGDLDALCDAWVEQESQVILNGTGDGIPTGIIRFDAPETYVDRMDSRMYKVRRLRKRSNRNG
jgi:hypothetical protein